MRLSNTAGSLGPGQPFTLSVTIDQSIASALSLGFYAGSISITDQTSMPILSKSTLRSLTRAMLTAR